MKARNRDEARQSQSGAVGLWGSAWPRELMDFFFTVSEH